ncbi:collagen alpha-2(VI) chain-like [Sardina pilchardus]|uniref:collagen alpha-2(VI) chain-like n=1 Tax=Sardina pilchardus TaxID=27697 RepID=UPI002E0D6811
MSNFSLKLFSNTEVIPCPINVYFVLDTSESVSLLELPPGDVVELIKLFTWEFALRLTDGAYRDAVHLSWTMGGLHFSDTNQVFSKIASRDGFLQAIIPITYIGRSTHVDCALDNMTKEIQSHHQHHPPGKPMHFVVVVTDGMENGYLCGGMKRAAERAKDLGYQLFAVGISSVRKNKEGLRQIASSPVAMYNGNLVAVNLASRTVSRTTIDRIVQTMCARHKCVEIDGAPGPKGAKGRKGDIGRPGRPGPQGPQGDDGPKGMRGEVGFKGSKGPVGFKGDKGHCGPPGLRGPLGEQGFPGDKGSTGDPGDEGPQGDVGAPGPKGKCGSPGEPGERGPPGGPGSPVSIENVCGCQEMWKGERGPEGPGSNDCDIMSYIREICGCCDCKKNCGALDIVFVIDSSESVGLTNFTLEKQFIFHTISRLGSLEPDPYSKNGVRVGVVQFSHLGTFEAIRLDDPNIDSLCSLRKAVKDLQWIAGGTWIPSALEFTYDTVIRQGRRAWARVAVVVITDGLYDRMDKPHSRLWSLCNDPGVEVLALGVSDSFNGMPCNFTLQNITCSLPQRIMSFSRYTDLLADEFTKEVESVLCPDPVTVCPDLPCQPEMVVAPCADRPVELVFLVDGSERVGEENFDRVRIFVETVTRKVRLASSHDDTTRVRLAVIQYGGHLEYQMISSFTHDRADLARRLKTMRYLDSSSNVTSAISFATDHCSGHPHPTRPGAELSFVFVTDGVTATQGLQEALVLVRKLQVVPVVVAMGNDVDKDVVLQLALKDRYAVFKGPDYKHLSNPDFLQRFIQWVC